MMKTKEWMANSAKAAVVAMMAAVASAGLTACSDKEDNPVVNNIKAIEAPEETVDPHVDQMLTRVTADVPTAVLGQFDETSMGAALVRRLPKTTTSVTDDTKMVLLKGSDIMNLKDDDILKFLRIYLKGGYIAIEKPTVKDLMAFLLQMTYGAVTVERDILTEDGDVTITPPNDEARSETSAQAERLKARMANLCPSTTRATEERDLDELSCEMIIIGYDSYYSCIPFEAHEHESVSVSVDGSETFDDEHHHEHVYTKRGSGVMADGAALWLNTRAQSRQERVAEARNLMFTRAEGGGQFINNLMDASEEHTYQSHLFRISSRGKGIEEANAHQETFRVWGVHNMKTNVDYYYVQQKVLLQVAKIFAGPKEERSWYVGDYKPKKVNYDLYYGGWLSKFESTLNLTGQGNPLIVEAIPYTDNNLISKSVSFEESHSESDNLGFSLGANIGYNPSINPSINYSHGWTDGYAIEMTHTSNHKELKVKKTSNGSEVKWTYTCSKDMSKPFVDRDDYWCHPTAPDLLIGDVDIDNQVCWSVKNPSGTYTLKTLLEPYIRGMFITQSNDPTHWISNDAWLTCKPSYTLKQPNRAVQTWYMDVTFPEIGTEGHHGDKGRLIEYLQRQFPSLYQTELQLADLSDTNESTIKNLVEYTKELLVNRDGAQTMRDYAKDLGLSQYTIKWYTIDGKHNKYELLIKAE